MSRYLVRITPLAEADADAIVDWIAIRSAAGAVNWYAAFWAAVESLERTPLAYGLADEAESLGREVRQRLFRTPRGRLYRLLYTIEPGEVRVIRVRGPGQPPIAGRDLPPQRDLS
ncbi:MAG: type II toxin-antitoxin system RelE/ParE family toxin [Planctomycetaceae bacterium]|nr:type II toxin-antitoxin system RelE/ParE family toxin [Planctomycetaceae bacterium]